MRFKEIRKDFVECSTLAARVYTAGIDEGALISPSTRAFTVRKKRAPLTSVTNPWALLKL